MATANPSLFGMLGDEAAMQRQLDEQRAQAFAQQSQEQRLASMGYKAGSQLGRGIAGAFGVEAIDDEVRQKVLLSRIAGEIDPTSEQSITEGIQKLRSAGFKDQADAVYKGYLENVKLKAEAAAKTAEKLTPEQRNAQARTDSLGLQRGTVEWNKKYNDILTELTSKEGKLTSFGRTLIEAGIEEGSPEFQELSKAFADATLKGAARGKGIDIVMPGQPVEAKDWLKFREYIDKNPVYKKATDITSVLPNALEVINMSTSNDIASAALPKALADIAGEGRQTSNADIARYAKTGGLDDRLISSAVGFISGRTTIAKKEQAKQFASAVYRGALMERRKALVSEAGQTGYDKSPNYERALQDIDAELAKFKKPSEMKAEPAPSKATGNPLIDKYLTK